MRALTLWQPHATLMSLVRPEPNPRRLAEKVFETRPKWAERIELGSLVIHAARSTEDLDYAGEEVCREVFRRHFPRGTLFRDILPLGAAVAVVDVVAVWETTDDRWLKVRPKSRGARGLLDGLHGAAMGVFGDFSPGRILLQCENVRRLAEPVPMRGHQQVWNLTPDQVALVNAQLPLGDA